MYKYNKNRNIYILYIFNKTTHFYLTVESRNKRSLPFRTDKLQNTLQMFSSTVAP